MSRCTPAGRLRFPDVDLRESLTLDVAGGRMDRTTTTARLRELAGTSVAA
jgi:hypothetical protein